jgi:translation initiation factor 3 subunit A
MARSGRPLSSVPQHIVQQAFTFCKDNERKTEFRRLCEMIRKDLATVNKYAHQGNSINLSDADVLARHIETRFTQLALAVELELWQEAFRSVEDIQGLLANPASKKAQKPAMMVSYYEKLTKVFKAEGGYMAVFHAAAWARYGLFQEKALKVAANGVLAGQEPELAKLAGFALLSALAVPVVEDGDGKRHAGKLVTLLNLQKMPTRAGLIKEAVRHPPGTRVPLVRNSADLPTTF